MSKVEKYQSNRQTIQTADAITDNQSCRVTVQHADLVERQSNAVTVQMAQSIHAQSTPPPSNSQSK